MALTLRFHAHSEVGLVRKNNQDSGYASDRLLVVADGMGGAAAGDLASTVAVHQLRSMDPALVDQNAPHRDGEAGPGANGQPGTEAAAGQEADQLLTQLTDRVVEANDMLADLTADYPQYDGMGTTVTAAAFDGTALAVVHIGDSRMYRLRNNECVRVTHDHSWVQSLIDDGRLTEEQAATHPHRSLLLRVLNGAPNNDPDVGVISARVGDRLLLCSDGLCGIVDDVTIARLMVTPDPAEAMDKLVQAAHAAGGSDNITIVLADIVDSDAFGAGSATAPQSPQTVGAAATTEVPEISERTQEIPIDLAAMAWPVVVDTEGNPVPEDVVTEAEDIDVQAQDIGPVPVASPSLGAGGPQGAESPRPAPVTEEGGADAAPEAAPVALDEEEEDRYSPKPAPPARRRVLTTLIALTVALFLFAVAGIGAWAVWRNSYFVAAENGHVAIFRGFDASIGPWDLNTAIQQEDIAVEDLSPRFQTQVTSTIPADSLDSARSTVQELADNAEYCRNVRATADAEAEEARRAAEEQAAQDEDGASPSPSPGASPDPDAPQPSFSPSPAVPDYGEC